MKPVHIKLLITKKDGVIKLSFIQSLWNKPVIFNDASIIILTLWMIKKIIIRKQIPPPSRIVNTSVVEWNHMSELGTQTVAVIVYWCFSILSDIMTAGRGITIPKFIKNGH